MAGLVASARLLGSISQFGFSALVLQFGRSRFKKRASADRLPCPHITEIARWRD
jgi:hypothetical protein